MHALFVHVLNASLYGSVAIAAVLLLRLALKRAPRSAVCLLWLLVGLRLLCPFEIESRLSLQPGTGAVTQTQWQQLEDYGQLLSPDFPIDTGIMEQSPGPDEVPAAGTDVDVEVDYEPNWAMILPYLWLAGVCGLGLHGLCSYLRLKRRVRDASHREGNIYVFPGLDTAFILGYFRPRIYLPMGLEESGFILDHERAHLRRGDHWFKLMGFTALAVHWFNPLVWLGYALLCRDLETACDEAVVRNLDLEQRKAYSAALLACSAHRSGIGACPVAFGEVSVKERIVSVLNYRRPRFWVCLLAAASIVFVAVCFLTNPAEASDESGTAGPAGHLEPAEVLAWAQELKAEDVEKIELLVALSGPNEQYHCYDQNSCGHIVALINGSNGQYVEEGNDPTQNRQCLTLTVTMTDGTRHILRNIGYTHLEIDGFHYEADYGWLSAWPNLGTSPAPEASLERCRLALEEFQSRDSYCLLTQLQLSGDMVSDSTTRFDYRSGGNWLMQIQAPGTDASNEGWYMEVDGVRYTRSRGQVHDPGNGEGGDSGWELGSLEMLPWLDTFDMDQADIQFIRASCGDEEDTVIFTVQGNPYPDEDKVEIMGYAVTFRFQAGTNTLRSVALQYTQMWPMNSNGTDIMATAQVAATTHPQEMAPEDIAAYIGQCHQEAKSQT